jgi:hypothetical protein
MQALVSDALILAMAVDRWAVHAAMQEYTEGGQRPLHPLLAAAQQAKVGCALRELQRLDDVVACPRLWHKLLALPQGVFLDLLAHERLVACHEDLRLWLVGAYAEAQPEARRRAVLEAVLTGPRRKQLLSLPLLSQQLVEKLLLHHAIFTPVVHSGCNLAAGGQPAVQLWLSQVAAAAAGERMDSGHQRVLEQAYGTPPSRLAPSLEDAGVHAALCSVQDLRQALEPSAERSTVFKSKQRLGPYTVSMKVKASGPRGLRVHVRVTTIPLQAGDEPKRLRLAGRVVLSVVRPEVVAGGPCLQRVAKSQMQQAAQLSFRIPLEQGEGWPRLRQRRKYWSLVRPAKKLKLQGTAELLQSINDAWSGNCSQGQGQGQGQGQEVVQGLPASSLLCMSVVGISDVGYSDAPL